jgi:hypothetical protein
MQYLNYFPPVYGVIWVALNFGCKAALPLAMGAAVILLCALATSRS